jgi:hypothetical protein
MDQIKMNYAKAAVEEILKADLQSNRKGNELLALEDWEMVLVGGGDTVVCW